MPQPSLPDVFPGATQDATVITIPWSAMPGLTASATNPADRTIAGIVSALITYYTPARRDGDANASPPVTGDLDVSIIAEMGRVVIVSSYDANNRIDNEEQTIDLRFYRPRANAAFDPDDY